MRITRVEYRGESRAVGVREEREENNFNSILLPLLLLVSSKYKKGLNWNFCPLFFFHSRFPIFRIAGRQAVECIRVSDSIFPSAYLHSTTTTHLNDWSVYSAVYCWLCRSFRIFLFFFFLELFTIASLRSYIPCLASNDDIRKSVWVCACANES